MSVFLEISVGTEKIFDGTWNLLTRSSQSSESIDSLTLPAFPARPIYDRDSTAKCTFITFRTVLKKKNRAFSLMSFFCAHF